MQLKTTKFWKFKNCYEITSNGKKLIVTTDVGPRIVFFGFIDSPENVLYFDENEKIGLGKWKLYGGHRFWVSPETMDTYSPDNHPCKMEEGNNIVSFITIDNKTNLEKRLSIYVENNNFIVSHTLTNRGEMLYYGGIWALTCIPVEGVIFFPWSTPGDWKMKKIIYWEKWPGQSTNIKSKQFDPENDLFLVYPKGEVAKLGTTGYEGFLGVTAGNYTFIKKFDFIQGAVYPDDNCAIEVYTSKHFCELETLSPTLTLIPGYSLTHKEKWLLFDRAIDPKDVESIRKIIKEEG